ncbi:MAG: Rap1a/Tai family immunity protein [Pseudomonadota bacterium]
MKKLILMMAVCAAPAWGQSFGQGMTVEQLLQFCKADDRFSRGSCNGYILGAVDAARSSAMVMSIADAQAKNISPTVEKIDGDWADAGGYCLPDNITYDAFLPIAMNGLFRTENKDSAASLRLMQIFSAAYPCP